MNEHSGSSDTASARPQERAETRAPVLLDLTEAQRAELKLASGIATRGFAFGRMELVALSLAAAAEGSDVLAYAKSAETRRQMLRSDDAPTAGEHAFIVSIRLNDEQKELIRQVTGRTLNWLKVTPDEFSVTYRESWKPDADAQRIGQSFLVVSGEMPMHTDTPLRTIALPQVAERAKGVFGTGQHLATQLAMCLMEQYVEPGHRVLDVGTGSGILAVAAARLGARQVLAVDIDPAAVDTARETVALNGSSDAISVMQGGVESTGETWDVVVANIYANVLIPLAPQLAAAVTRGGMLLTSGIVDARVPAVSRAMMNHRLREESVLAREQWRAIAYRAGVS